MDTDQSDTPYTKMEDGPVVIVPLDDDLDDDCEKGVKKVEDKGENGSGGDAEDNAETTEELLKAALQREFGEDLQYIVRNVMAAVAELKLGDEEEARKLQQETDSCRKWARDLNLLTEDELNAIAQPPNDAFVDEESNSSNKGGDSIQLPVGEEPVSNQAVPLSLSQLQQMKDGLKKSVPRIRSDVMKHADPSRFFLTQTEQQVPCCDLFVTFGKTFCNGWWTDRQEKALMVGQYCWTFLFLDELGNGNSDSAIVCLGGNSIFLFFLWCNKTARRTALEATHLIPTMYVVSTEQEENDGFALLVILAIIVATNVITTIHPLASWIGKRTFTNANGRQAMALYLGLWICPLVLCCLMLGSLNEFFYPLVGLGNGMLTFLLWCNKCARNELNDQQKKLLASEVVPTMVFGLFGDPVYLILAIAIAFFVVCACLAIAAIFHDEPERIPWICKTVRNTLYGNLVFWTSPLREMDDERFLRKLKLGLLLIIIFFGVSFVVNDLFLYFLCVTPQRNEYIIEHSILPSRTGDNFRWLSNASVATATER